MNGRSRFGETGALRSQKRYPNDRGRVSTNLLIYLALLHKLSSSSSSTKTHDRDPSLLSHTCDKRRVDVQKPFSNVVKPGGKEVSNFSPDFIMGRESEGHV